MNYLDRPRPFERGDGGAWLISVTGASFITTLGLFIYSYAVGEHTSLGSHAAVGLLTFLVMSVIGVFTALLVGLPLTLLLRSFRLERPWTYPLLGAATGALVAWLLLGRGTEGLLVASLGSIPGGIAGLIW